jgi:hypothetical protein
LMSRERQMNSKNVWLIDAAVAIPAFGLAAYMGANIAISIACAALAASFVNLMGAAGIFGRPRS